MGFLAYVSICITYATKMLANTETQAVTYSNFFGGGELKELVSHLNVILKY